ncbi:MAG: hypothetical protein J0L92_28060 [Deltaproteobacteria bacterium]|nr:hypothetical protein [Deltaproteobacteria bacterium]
MDVRLHDGMLCARTDGTIPKVCLLCGATKDVVRRTQEYPIGASYGAGAGAGGGVVGALVAQSLRGIDRMLAAMVITGIVVVVAIGAWMAHRATPRVAMALPLCTRCDARWAEGEQRRTWFVLALGVFLLLTVVGIALDAMWLLGAGLALVLGLVLFARATDQAKRFVQVGFVQKDEIGLRLSKEIAEMIVERARRRAEKENTASASAVGETSPREASGDQKAKEGT